MANAKRHSIALTLLLSAVLLLLMPTASRAQHLQASLSHYSTDDGLPSNTVASLATDDYGYVWVATWNGLSRFDGYNFYNYKTGIASGIKGLHNRIDNITVDQAQNVWMKMYDGRVFVINRQTDCIEDPLAGISGHEDFHVDYFFNPYVTTTGDVLISFGNIGLYKIRLNRNGLKQELIMTNNLTVNCIVEGYRNDLWVGTDQGVHRIDMGNLALERKGYLLDEHITRLASNGYNIFVGTKSGKIMQFSYGQEPTLVKDIGREITSLFVDSHGLLWFSDLGDGCYRLNPESGDIKAFQQHVPVPEFTSRGAEYGEALGVVWIRMNHGGYGYYNRETDEVEYFHNDPSNPWNLSNTVNARLELNDGVIWESTVRRGLEKLEVQRKTIERTLLMPESAEALDNEVRAMCHDRRRNHTLIANKHGRIFVYDGKMQLIHTITHDSKGNPISRPYGMSVDSKGNYWVCDKDNGIYKITPTSSGNYDIVNYRHDDKNPYSLSSNAAYQAIEDRQGNIWVATYGGGINILRKNKSGGYTALHAKNTIKHYPRNTHQKARTLALANDGSVWVGTTDGILIMQIRNNSIIVSPLESPEVLENGLMSNDIVNLLCTPDGTMWVGTNSGGLSHTTTKDEQGAWQFVNYGIETGLPSEEIHSMTYDERGNIWFATDHILCSFDTKKTAFTTFSTLDGVDETMLSEGSAITLSNGNILFGSMIGFYTVDRRKLTTPTGSLLRLHITDFYLNEELQSPRLTDNYSYYVPQSQRVVLPYHGCHFSFRFASLNYQLQHRIHYQYRLEGYDNEWTNADKSRKVTYRELPTGTYHLQVKAFLLESPDAYDLRSIEVVVPPLFLLSATAIWIYMPLLAIILLGGLWWYQERLRKQYHAHAEPADTESEGRDTTSVQEEEEAIILDDQQEEVTDAYEIIDD